MAEKSGLGQIMLTVLLPAFNEEAAIDRVVAEIRDAMSSYRADWELLVVDDSSSDSTAERGVQLGARVLRHDHRQGSGAARKTGIRAAQGTVIAMLDADGSYPASELPKLLDLIHDYDQVNGARTSEEGTLRWLRMPAKWFIRKLAEFVSGHRIPDLNTGMKVFRREPMLQYLDMVSDGFSCVSSMTLVMLCNGYRVKYVPIEYRPRIGKSKFRPVRDTASYIRTVVRIALQFRPMRVLMPIAIALGALAAINGLVERIYLSRAWSPSAVIFGSLAGCMAIGAVAAEIGAQGSRHRSSSDAHRLDSDASRPVK